jgi:2-desacetyl-2-hydroxyethyl bacteriochlorophyllide A dehydrogenase
MIFMKAAVYYGPYNVKIENRPIPIPGPNQLVVKIDYCGICGTDMHSYKMEGIINPPIIFGHENVGTVYAVGEGVTDYTVGDHILCGPPSHCEENCSPCKIGATNICIHGFPRTAGIGGPDGGYAEYMLVRDVAHTMLIKVNPEIDLKQAVLFDVVCVSFHAIRKSNFKFGDNVVVSGTGPIGLAAMRLLKAAGANKIVALGTTESKFEMLRSYGADYTINPKTTSDLKSELCKIFGRDVAADVVFECAGNAASIENSVYKCVKPGGQVMLIGTGAEGMGGIIPARYVFNEVDINCSFVYTSEEVKTYLEMLKAGKIEFSGLVTSVVSLDECVAKGLGLEDRSKQLKILIDPSL